MKGPGLHLDRGQMARHGASRTGVKENQTIWEERRTSDRQIGEGQANGMTDATIIGSMDIFVRNSFLTVYNTVYNIVVDKIRSTFKATH